MTGPLVFIAADHRECAPWVARWDAAKWELAPAPALPVHWVRYGKWHGRDVIAIANGAGPAQASAAVNAIEHLHPAALVSIGTCGALDSSLHVGDIFVPTEIQTTGRKWTLSPFEAGKARRGSLISVTRIASTASEKKQLRATGAMAVEMESAGVADASERLGVPFYCVRVVSDLADQEFANDFNKVLMPDGRFNIPALLLNALARPLSRIPELFSLAQRTALASKNLGEFLALCSF